MTFLLGLVPSFIPPQFRKAAVFAMLGLLLLALLGGVKCAYDKSVIERHDAKRDAQIAKADRKADTKAAEQRRVDDALIVTEREEIKEAVNEAATSDPAARRAAYYECLRKIQQARRDKLAPRC